MFEINTYWPNQGLLHDFDPRFKTGALAWLSILLTLTSWPGLITFSVFGVLLIILSGVPLRIYKSVFIVLCWLAIFYGLALGLDWTKSWHFWLWHWSPEGLWQAGMMIWRVGIIFFLTRLYTAVTPPLDQGMGIAYFFNPLVKITPLAADLALLLTLTLRFISLLEEEAALLWKARVAKGVWPSGWLKRGKEVVLLLPPLLLLSLRRAEETADNLLARGYSPGRYHVFIPYQWKGKDRWGMIFLMIFSIGILFLH